MAGGRSLSTENDSHRGLALAPGLQTHGQRVAHRNSTHSFALDKTFRFIDGMTKGRAMLPWRAVGGQKVFLITLGGPPAHDSFGRDDNFVLLWVRVAKIDCYPDNKVSC